MVIEEVEIRVIKGCEMRSKIKELRKRTKKHLVEKQSNTIFQGGHTKFSD